MDKQFKKELVKKEDEKAPQYIFISKIRYKEPIAAIEEYYNKNKDMIEAWQQEHPDAKPRECIEATGLARRTVYRYWQKAKPTER